MEKQMKVLMTKMPSLTIDLQESLGLVKVVLSDIVEKSGEETKKAFRERDFKISNEISYLAETSHQYEMKLAKIIDSLDVEEIEEDLIHNEEENLNKDYDKYKVDQNIEYTLYDNFKHKRPHGYQINNEQIVRVRTWKEMYTDISEKLINIDERRFLSFENNPSMNGRRKPYYSTDKRLLRKPFLISDKIYIETNHSANHLRNLIIKSLKAYSFQPKEVKIFLRADYSNLNYMNN